MNEVLIKGMSCGHCGKAVREALEGLGLKNVEVDIESGKAVFAQAEIDIESLREAVEDAGFEIG